MSGQAPMYPVAGGLPRQNENAALVAVQLVAPAQQRAAAAAQRAAAEAPDNIRVLNENDVLLGRGRGASKHIGNKKFRDLIKQHKAEYNSCDKHNSKVNIAFHVRTVIRSRGGRFLELVGTAGTQNGQPARSVIETGTWKIAREDVALERCKQSLREKELTQEQKNKIKARNVAKRVQNKRRILGEAMAEGITTEEETAAELRRLAEAEERILQQQASRAAYPPSMMPPPTNTNNFHPMLLAGGPPPRMTSTAAAVHHSRQLMSIQQALLQRQHQQQQQRAAAVHGGAHYQYLNPLYLPRSNNGAIGTNAMAMRDYGQPLVQHSPVMPQQARLSSYHQEALRSQQAPYVGTTTHAALRAAMQRINDASSSSPPPTAAALPWPNGVQGMGHASSSAAAPQRAVAAVTDTEKDALSALFALSGETNNNEKANLKATKFAAL